VLLLIIGVVLIIVGALVYRELGPEPIVRLAAALLVLAGVILAILGIVALADVHSADAVIQSSYGTGRAMASYGTGLALA
jgi:predicted membrane-bound dolichyl-phosphate-mannose-protein mannosyltransferase